MECVEVAVGSSHKKPSISFLSIRCCCVALFAELISVEVSAVNFRPAMSAICFEASFELLLSLASLESLEVSFGSSGGASRFFFTAAANSASGATTIRCFTPLDFDIMMADGPTPRATIRIGVMSVRIKNALVFTRSRYSRLATSHILRKVNLRIGFAHHVYKDLFQRRFHHFKARNR